MATGQLPASCDPFLAAAQGREWCVGRRARGRRSISHCACVHPLPDWLFWTPPARCGSTPPTHSQLYSTPPPSLFPAAAVGDVELINCYYAHQPAQSCDAGQLPLARRCYWLLDAQLGTVVLVHYLNSAKKGGAEEEGVAGSGGRRGASRKRAASASLELEYSEGEESASGGSSGRRPRASKRTVSGCLTVAELHACSLGALHSWGTRGWGRRVWEGRGRRSCWGAGMPGYGASALAYRHGGGC